MSRGEIWWAELAPPIGRRPVLIITRTAALRVRQSVTVIPLSRRIRGLLTEIKLGKADGFMGECAANADNIQTVSKELFLNHLTTLAPLRMAEIDKAIRFALDLSANLGR